MIISFQKKAEKNKFQTRMWPYYGRKNRGHTHNTYRQVMAPRRVERGAPPRQQ